MAKPKIIKPLIRTPCAGCGKMLTARGKNGHKCPGHAKPGGGSSSGSVPGADHLSPPPPGNSTVTRSMTDMLMEEASVRQNPETSELVPVPSKEELEHKYRADAQTWAGIFWLIGDTEDRCVDWVAARYPSEAKNLMKCNLSRNRALEMGELAYQVVGPTKPEYVLAAYIIGTFMPPMVSMIIVMLPKEAIAKVMNGMIGQTNRMLAGLKPPEKKEEPKA